MTREDAKTVYCSLFDSEKSKADAFDLIAEKYYYSNFGSASKADIDVLMFSLYIEQILKKDQKDFRAYSDYTLSKQLGITQSKVSNLKVRKELVYPYTEFDWKKSLQLISDRAIFEDDKIKLFIPDRNLYLEIKNAVETSGGYVELQLTPNLLQIRLPFFLDLMVSISEEANKADTIQRLKEKIQENSKSLDISQEDSFGRLLLNEAPNAVFEIVEKCIPVFGGAARIVAEKIFNVVKKKWEEDK